MKLAHSALLAITIACSSQMLRASQGTGDIDPALPSGLTSEEIGKRVSSTEKFRLDNLSEYSVVRKYKLHNSHMAADAEMTVRLNYDKGTGKKFEILNTNATGISRRVLEKLVESEAESSRLQNRDEFHITEANYRFNFLGTGTLQGRKVYVVELIPRRRSKLLLQGRIWVDPSDFGVIRVEGRPAASLSMWVGKPYVVQDFQKLGDFWMATHNHSESQSFVLGASVLTIDYADYRMQSGSTNVAQTSRHHLAPVD